MATVTGALSDFTINPFPELNPRLVFTPSGPGLFGARLFATKPIIVTPAGSGSFAVELQPTDYFQPAVWYTISIEWLDTGSNYNSVDFVDWKLFVPSGGGELSDLVATPANPFLFWVGETPPLYPTPGQKWLNPSTGDLKEWN